MKHLEKIKYFVTGMLVATIFGAMMPSAFAASTARKIDAFFNSIKIYVDDTLIKPKDAAGNTVEPFIYNGTVYLPVKAVAEAVDKSVQWDGRTNSVYLGKHTSKTPVANLIDMDMFYGDEFGYDVFRDGEKDNTGKEYDQGILLSYTGNSVYTLNQKYSHFKGKIALHYDWRDTPSKSVIKIYGDNKLLYTSPSMTKGVKPVDFDVDITGVVELKIERNIGYNSVLYTTDRIIFSGLDFYN